MKAGLLLLAVQLVLAICCEAVHRRQPHWNAQIMRQHLEQPFNSPSKDKVNAVIVVLVRNRELRGVEAALKSFEQTFNHQYQYPYVFLNDEVFTDDFKSSVTRLSNSKMSFGLIPFEHWSYPPWIDQAKASLCRKDMQLRHVLYGGSVSYRHMCRFNSGFFYKHPLLQQYDYYWRVEPFVTFFCTLSFDPFEVMKQHDYYYGFTIMTTEISETIPTLWNATKSFMRSHAHLIPRNNALSLLTDDDQETYNLCHFWSNFEIGNLNFFRSKEYNAYFNYLDKMGGFFYERWGDAPVHSIGLSMFLPIERIHFFEEIGYLHRPFQNCPASGGDRCACNPEDSHNLGHQCMNRFQDVAFRDRSGLKSSSK